MKRYAITLKFILTDSQKRKLNKISKREGLPLDEIISKVFDEDALKYFVSTTINNYSNLSVATELINEYTQKIEAGEKIKKEMKGNNEKRTAVRFCVKIGLVQDFNSCNHPNFLLIP